MNQWGFYISILFVWIGAWNLVDLTVQKFVSEYAYQMIVYACLFVIGAIILIVVNATTK